MENQANNSRVKHEQELKHKIKQKEDEIDNLK
jgi:hypothetical protein